MPINMSSTQSLISDVSISTEHLNMEPSSKTHGCLVYDQRHLYLLITDGPYISPVLPTTPWLMTCYLMDMSVYVFGSCLCHFLRLPFFLPRAIRSSYFSFTFLILLQLRIVLSGQLFFALNFPVFHLILSTFHLQPISRFRAVIRCA